MSEQKAVTPSPKATSPVVPRLWGLEVLCFSSALATLILHYPAQYLPHFRELGLVSAFFLKPGSFIFILVGILALSGLSYRYMEEPCKAGFVGIPSL